MSRSTTDKIYQSKLERIKQFCFDEQVATVFDDMVSRSVPRYSEVQAATVKLANKVCPPGGKIVDLGCSTGTTLFSIAKERGDFQLVGIDSSPQMLEQARQKAEALGLQGRISFICQDIAEYDYLGIDLVISNYTLQFFPPEGRGELLCRICDAINPGGAIIISEKLQHAGEESEGILRSLYYDFKEENGYSKLEISQKREALEGFLVPLTLEENLRLLKSSGFKEVELYLKWINFATFLGLR